MSTTNKVTKYTLKRGTREIDVGSTRPSYDNVKKGWVTDVGMFATSNPGDYVVTRTDTTVATPPAE